MVAPTLAWAREERDRLLVEIRDIESGDATIFQIIGDGEKTDVTANALADLKRRLREAEALIAALGG